MRKRYIFWFILSLVFAVAALFLLPDPSIRFGGYFLGMLFVCCLGQAFAVLHAPRHKTARIAAQIGRVLFALFCVSFVCIQFLIVSGARADPEASDAQYVLVLGSHIWPDRPSAILAERLQTAADFLQAHPDATAILCGGQGQNEPMPESHMMKQYMVESLGIDPDRLLIEDTSVNTIQNIQNAKALYHLESHSCAVISSNFHLARARRLMKRAGLDPYGIPAPMPNLALAIASHLREYCSTLGLLLSFRYF